MAEHVEESIHPHRPPGFRAVLGLSGLRLQWSEKKHAVEADDVFKHPSRVPLGTWGWRIPDPDCGVDNGIEAITGLLMIGHYIGRLDRR